MIKVTAVSYLNTKPFIYGIFQTGLDTEIELTLDIPSVCAKKLAEGTVDLGLVPVAVIPKLETPHIISDYCIGSVGPVKTVSIFSDCPIEEVETIFMDFHSRTSVALAKLLLKDYWKVKAVPIPAHEGFINEIGGKTAALVIGDRTIGLEAQHPFVYDLAEYWEKHTGLPFVFAAWVSNKPLDDVFVTKFNHALKTGLAGIPKLLYLLPSPRYNFDLQQYFQRYINYDFDEKKKEALKLFLSRIADQSCVEKLVGV